MQSVVSGMQGLEDAYDPWAAFPDTTIERDKRRGVAAGWLGKCREHAGSQAMFAGLHTTGTARRQMRTSVRCASVHLFAL